jgi:hypothetical protein
MDIEIKALLYDMLNAVNEIDSFFIDTPKEFTALRLCWYEALLCA